MKLLPTSGISSSHISNFYEKFSKDNAVRAAHAQSVNLENINVCQSTQDQSQFVVFTDNEWQSKMNSGLFTLVYTTTDGYVFDTSGIKPLVIKPLNDGNSARSNRRSNASKSSDLETSELLLVCLR